MRLRLLVVCLLVASPIAAQVFESISVKEVDASRGVGDAVSRLPRNGTTWAAWTAPTTASICCWQGGRGCCGRCSLNSRNEGFSISNDDAPLTDQMVIVARLEDGSVERVRLYNGSCPIAGNGETVYLLKNASAESSLDYLKAHIHDVHKAGQLMAAISMHHHPRVVNDLIAFARHDRDTDVRRDAIFWLGQKAGDKAAAELRRTVDEDPDDDVKEHAVFAISQLPRQRAVPMLIELVRTHKSRSVRKKAMFWLAQTGDQRAIDVMEEILLR